MYRHLRNTVVNFFNIMILLLGLSMCHVSCMEDRYDNINPDLIIAGHAGSGFNYLIDPFNPLPANSWSSIKRAINDGADGIEIDVQLSSDNQLILYHDTKLDSKTKLQGCIAEKSAEEVIGIKYVLGFPYDIFHSESVLSLEQLVNYLSDSKQVPNLYFDLKPKNDCSSTDKNQQFSDMVEALLDWNSEGKYPIEKLLIISASDSILCKLKRAIPELTLVKEGYGDIDMNIEAALNLGVDGLIYPVSQIEKNSVEKIKQAGLMVMLFGGKSTRTIRDMIESGADVIQVNHVAKAVRIRRTMLVPEH